ncbi:hypothetical protein MA16_Dca010328 [Dendrobium catenatum]|uniref:Uncharacterized protein n=1 Tax=Dendrobium catenatum TaxID=906689 RepID=A0A2I0X807_9ASPA|nr:hypothetical protein MA16_Dca010328 [Dendrobium catenatum]
MSGKLIFNLNITAAQFVESTQIKSESNFENLQVTFTAPQAEVVATTESVKLALSTSRVGV